jgi:hypothetical protein
MVNAVSRDRFGRISLRLAVRRAQVGDGAHKNRAAEFPIDLLPSSSVRVVAG